mgnify:CR=1 FL=1
MRLRLPESAWARCGLAALVGAAGVLAFAPFELFWLAWPVWLALFLLLRAETGARAGFLTGLCFGWGFFLTGTSWVYVSLSVFGGMPFWLAGIATLLFCTVLALLPAFAGVVFVRWRPATAWRQALWFGALFFAADWLRGWLFTGFPWLALGYSQTPPSPMAGYAPLLGVYGLTLLVAASAALLVRWRVGVPVLAVLLALGGGLRQVEWTDPVGMPIQVALVQGNVAQDMKFRPEQFVRTLISYRDLIDRHPAQLTVLPETAIPAFYDQLPPEFIDELRQLARRQGGDLIFGVPTGEGERYWNSAVTLGTSSEQHYRKRHLVPFGEIIPPGFDWFLALARIPLASFTRGEAGQAPLAVAGQHVAANICYEDAFGEEIIEALPKATLLANLSNTAWFGRSLAQPQHLQIARLRTLETGRPMLRATNTGMTAVLGARGEIVAALPPFTTGVLRAEIRGYQGMTPFARAGNWLAAALALIAALAAFALCRRAVA